MVVLHLLKIAVVLIGMYALFEIGISVVRGTPAFKWLRKNSPKVKKTRQEIEAQLKEATDRLKKVKADLLEDINQNAKAQKNLQKEEKAYEDLIKRAEKELNRVS